VLRAANLTGTAKEDGSLRACTTPFGQLSIGLSISSTARVARVVIVARVGEGQAPCWAADRQPGVYWKEYFRPTQAESLERWITTCVFTQ
jgi:hypothetical protein